MIDLIIPAYNNEDTIGRTLASILAQTRPRKFMVTVVDECSTDATAAVVAKFKGLLLLNYIKLDKNLGKPGLVRNIGIKNTKNPYIVFLDADDILAPNAAEVLSRAILQDKPDFINSAFYQDNRNDNYNIISSSTLTWLHGNIYSRKFLEKYSIKFDDKWNEDGSFNLKCFWLSENKKKIEQPMCYWMDNKESVTRKNKHFMLDIGEDYVSTYTAAIQHIVNRKPLVITDIGFINICAGKLAEFIQFIDAYNYYKINTDKLYIEINEYIRKLEEYKLITSDFLKLTNTAFNKYNIFIDFVRQDTLINYLSNIGIKWSDYVNE